MFQILESTAARLQLRLRCLHLVEIGFLRSGLEAVKLPPYSVSISVTIWVHGEPADAEAAGSGNGRVVLVREQRRPRTHFLKAVVKFRQGRKHLIAVGKTNRGFSVTLISALKKSGQGQKRNGDLRDGREVEEPQDC